MRFASILIGIMNTEYNFTLNEDINGPFLANAVCVEMIMSLIANSFVLIFTMSHPKILKQPAIIFLTNFILGNWFMTFVYLPSTIISAATGEWVLGSNEENKHATCAFVGFLLLHNIHFTTLCLTVISIDRFLFIVKPCVHQRVMKPWVAILISISVWILACLLSSTPYFGLGEFGFSGTTASCVAVWPGNLGFVIFTVMTVLIFVTIIVTMTLWTFYYTKKFIRQLNTIDQQTHVYKTKIRKIFGIFGVMLLVNALSYLPGIFVGFIGFAIGIDELPNIVWPIVTILFFLNYVLNPVIQAYFRKELNDLIVKNYRKVFHQCSKQDSSQQ